MTDVYYRAALWEVCGTENPKVLPHTNTTLVDVQADVERALVARQRAARRQHEANHRARQHQRRPAALPLLPQQHVRYVLASVQRLRQWATPCSAPPRAALSVLRRGAMVFFLRGSEGDGEHPAPKRSE